MSTLREKVARALAVSIGGPEEEEEWRAYIGDADAAIAVVVEAAALTAWKIGGPKATEAAKAIRALSAPGPQP